MADKKVERMGRERPTTPTQKMKAALSDAGMVNVADINQDKGKAALVDKFREREERWRREQSLQAQQAQSGHGSAGRTVEEEGEGIGEDVLDGRREEGPEPTPEGGRPKGGAL
jgi:hypothetical protein